MYFEEFGKGNEKTIVMLHSENYVFSFENQYSLADKYHIVVPHLMGFGENTEKPFQTDECVQQLAEFIGSLDKKVLLVGFSLGAQVGFKLISEHQDLFIGAILVSPLLIKDEALMSKVAAANLRQHKLMKNKLYCNFLGAMNGMHTDERKAFVAQTQNIAEETTRNIVYNGITLESVPQFADVKIPVIALAGGKEQQQVRDSVLRMSEINPRCECRIWERAKHDIPVKYANKFNNMIRRLYK